jgi:hypothetical protein
VYKVFITALVIILTASLVGCSTPVFSSNDPSRDITSLPNGSQLAFSVEGPSLPSPITEIVEVVRQTGGARTINLNERTYIVIALGQRSTSGYSIEIGSISKKSDHVEISYTENEPNPNQSLAQMITHPYVVISIPQSQLPVRFEKS